MNERFESGLREIHDPSCALLVVVSNVSVIFEHLSRRQLILEPVDLDFGAEILCRAVDRFQDVRMVLYGDPGPRSEGAGERIKGGDERAGSWRGGVRSHVHEVLGGGSKVQSKAVCEGEVRSEVLYQDGWGESAF